MGEIILRKLWSRELMSRFRFVSLWGLIYVVMHFLFIYKSENEINMNKVIHRPVIKKQLDYW